MIEPEDISVGDVVRLKSGSPKMTVTKIVVLGKEASISVLLWSDRLGFIEDDIPLNLLVWPRNEKGDV